MTKKVKNSKQKFYILLGQSLIVSFFCGWDFIDDIYFGYITEILNNEKIVEKRQCISGIGNLL